MGVAIYPNTASVIKSLQTGTASSAGTITITAVNVAKAVVHSFTTSTDGTVAATGTINAANGNTSGMSTSGAYINIGPFAVSGTSNGGSRYIPATYNAAYNANYGAYWNAINTNGVSVGLNTTSLTGGTTALNFYGAYLTNSTTLTVTGPCRYQIVEYY